MSLVNFNRLNPFRLDETFEQALRNETFEQALRNETFEQALRNETFEQALRNETFEQALENLPTFEEDHAQDDEDAEFNYADLVEAANNLRHERAIVTNTDGGIYLKSVIDEHLQTLNEGQRQEFARKIEECSPELFISIPLLAVDKAISSSTPLTEENTPHFMHTSLDALENLRQERGQLLPGDLWNKSNSIAFSFARQTDFIASIQRALQQ